MMKNDSSLKVGERITGTVDALANGGKAIIRHEGMAIFVDRGLPGQTIAAQITKRSKRFAEASLLKIVTPAGNETEAPCPHFGDCGGCHWQNLAYDEQCRWKEQYVTDALRRIGGIAEADSRKIISAHEQLFYRNKMEFAFAPAPSEGEQNNTSGTSSPAASKKIQSAHTAEAPFGNKTLLGLRRLNAHEIIEVTDCKLQSARTMDIVQAIRDAVNTLRLPAYSPQTKRGYLRFLVIRESHHTNECLVQLITTPDYTRNAVLSAKVETMGKELVERFGLTSFIHSERKHAAQIAYGENIALTIGEPAITEELLGKRFALGPDSFFQTNTVMAERLYENAINLAELTGKESVWDLYCGVGTIALSASANCKQVTGLEITPEAVANAKANAKTNGVNHAEFTAGDVRRLIGSLQNTPDVVFTDPPRAGMDAEVVKELCKRGPKRIIYISCNPATQARDIGLMQDHYDITAIQPVDLFPQTPHVENIIRLDRK